MDIVYKGIKDTGEMVEAAKAFREFYLDYIEEFGEKRLKKAIASALSSGSYSELGRFKTKSRTYEVLVNGRHILVEAH